MSWDEINRYSKENIKIMVHIKYYSSENYSWLLSLYFLSYAAAMLAFYASSFLFCGNGIIIIFLEGTRLTEKQFSFSV